MFTQETCLTNFKEQKIYRRQLQKQSFRSILKDFEIFIGNIYGGACFPKTVLNTRCLPSIWKF